MNSAVVGALGIPRAVESAELPAHLPSLDGLRGLAIALVVLHNVNVLHGGASIPSRGVEWLAGFSWVGVQLFFVLSGFLITRGLLETQGARNYFSAFYGRRALRIMPLYYATLFAVFVLWPWLGNAANSEDSRHQIWLWLFLSNWSTAAGFSGGSLPHFWSLAVEEQFYLLWPFVVMKRTPRQLLVACAVVAVLALLVRSVMWLAHVPPELMYVLTFSRMDALATGAAAAAVVRLPGMLQWLVARRGLLLWAALATLLLGKLIPHAYWLDASFGPVVGYSILSVVFALVVLAAACADVAPSMAASGVLRWRVLRVLGKYSYAMYVLHPLVNGFLGTPILERLLGSQPPSLWQSLLYALSIGLASLALAWVSWHLLEKRFLALKRFFQAQPPAARPPEV